MITIQNMRGGNYPRKPWDVRCDRKSVLGNHFPMRRLDERDKVCELYQQWFDNQCHDGNEKVIGELMRLVDLYIKYGKLNLFCWCVPQRCHIQTIKIKLEEMIHARTH